MSPIVVDASVTMAWCFEDESTPQTEAVLDRVVSGGAVVPPLWTTEVTNVLVVAERRGRLSEAQSMRFTSLLSQLPITVAVDSPSASALLALARNHGLTAYDSTYLWLAASRGLSLATLDVPLRTACTAAGVPTMPA